MDSLVSIMIRDVFCELLTINVRQLFFYHSYLIRTLLFKCFANVYIPSTVLDFSRPSTDKLWKKSNQVPHTVGHREYSFCWQALKCMKYRALWVIWVNTQHVCLVAIINDLDFFWLMSSTPFVEDLLWINWNIEVTTLTGWTGDLNL